MASIILSLPSEILDNIFSTLSHEQQTIATCRLVCSSFKELSSPYLITRVVFARRLKTLSKLREVVDHPYFHKYITELVYDASSYEQRIANWMTYVHACSQADQHLEDPEWLQRKNNDDAEFLALTRWDESYDADGSEDEVGAQFTSRQEDWYRMGCHKSFPDYGRLCDMQDRLDSSGFLSQLLVYVLKKLPALRIVRYSDFRGLARRKESYKQCCRRLFGNTLAPQHLNYIQPKFLHQFMALLEAIRSCPDSCIESIAVGPHCFEDNSLSSHSHDPRAVQHIPIDLFTRMDDREGSNLDRNFRRLRHLRLPLSNRNESRWFGHISNFVQACAPNLRHLGLHNEQQPAGADLDGLTLNAFLLQIHFPCLRHLDLRNWRVTADCWQDLLSRLAGSLRELHLLRCWVINQQSEVGEDSGEPKNGSRELSLWAGTHLQLDGVEIAEAWVPPKSTVDHPSDKLGTMLTADMETLWLGGNKNFIVRESVREHLDGSGSERGKWSLQRRENFGL